MTAKDSAPRTSETIRAHRRRPPDSLPSEESVFFHDLFQNLSGHSVRPAFSDHPTGGSRAKDGGTSPPDSCRYNFPHGPTQGRIDFFPVKTAHAISNPFQISFFLSYHSGTSPLFSPASPLYHEKVRSFQKFNDRKDKTCPSFSNSP